MVRKFAPYNLKKLFERVEMKKAIFLFFILLMCSSCSNKPHEYTKADCFEEHICKEGMEIIFDGETTKRIITKETCLQHNYQWKEEIKACYTYKN